MTDTGRKLAGRYALGEVLGRGGMGTVYRARDEVLDREVAVKVLPESVADRDPTNIARFEREARSAAALNHRGVVSVYDAGADDGVRYIVMELVDGRSLEAVLKGEGAIDAARVAQIGAGVADALAAAHAAGIVHRDIKPANVMLAADGTVKVLDFGIARAVEGVTLTQTASVIGTAAYMAPEQVTGGAIDERSDLYSLGCVLYALLAGHAAFRGDNAAAILHQQASVDPPPPSEESAGVPPALDGLVMGLLAKDPAQRPQRAASVKDQLSAIVAGADTADAGRAAPTAVAGAAGAAELPRRTYRTGRLGTRAEPTRIDGTRVQPPPPAPTAATKRLAADAPAPSRRALLIGAAGLALIILLALILGRNGSLPIAHNAGASHTSSTQTKRTHSSTTTTHASSTTPAPAATTVPGAIAELQSLIAADQRAGTVDAHGAQPLTAKLAEVQQSVAAGNLADAQHHEIELAQMVPQLQGQGHITPAAAPALTTAVARLGTLLDQAAASASSTTPTGPPAAGPGSGKGKGHGKGNGNGNGNGDGGD